MSQNIANLFIKAYEKKVHHAYQQRGKNLARFCRVKTKVVGKDLTFPKMGTSTTGTKARGAEITPDNPDMSQVVCTIVNQYHRVDIEDLDTYKTNVSEQMELIDSAMIAMKVYEDNLILKAIDDGLQAGNAHFLHADNNVGLTEALAKELSVRAGKVKLFEDESRPPVCLVGDEQWDDLTSINTFSNADYVSFKGTLPNNMMGGKRMKHWKGILWCAYSSLPYDAATKRRTCMLWDWKAVGVGKQKQITVSAQHYNTHDANVVTHKTAQGAILIDELGAFKFNCLETIGV